MDYNLSEFDRLAKEGYVRRVENDRLVLYNYTDKTTYERFWDAYTRDARGIIFEKATGKLIAKPFPKFFNLNEMPETRLESLPKTSYEVYEKVDGSLGIMYYYGGKWNVATRGSLNSEQAQKAQEMLSRYDLTLFHTGRTYLLEIIYPDNKIVVDYGSLEELVLLGGYDEDGINEIGFNRIITLANASGMRHATQYQYSIEEMIALQKTIPKDKEGFVVRYPNGLRVKIKGDEYMRIAKLISEMSPISFWESMVNGMVSRDYIVQLPEECRPEYEPILNTLEDQYILVKKEIADDLKLLPVLDVSIKDNARTLGIFLQSDKHGLKHPGAIFPYLMNRQEAVDKYIMKYIRPTGNALRVYEKN